MESKNDLERTYSREQQRLGEAGLEAVATPVALVRSVTSRSQKSAKSGRSSRSRRKPDSIAQVVKYGNVVNA
jgi:hypothetical protein